MEKLDAALLALDAEIFSDGQPLTANDDFLVTVLSKWSATKRKNIICALIQNYGSPDLGTHIVHALARLICRDVERELASMLGPIIQPHA